MSEGAAYSGAWLATKLGVDQREIDLRRRTGELLGVPAEKGGDYLYPVWQFDAAGRPLPAIARLVRVAREAGLGDAELAAVLEQRDGMTGEGRLLDGVRAGREDRAVDAIRAAGRLRGG